MSYGNAVPKPLKFLISDGKMIDDAGNVIAESDTLKDLYTKWAPEVKKYLLSDGSVVDENNNLIVKNDYYKKIYDQATPKVAKYLHADGTIDENSGGGGGADLEDNHQTTIDVSAYTEPVEVEPSQGYDGMKKVTVSLSNMPAGANMLYAWACGDYTYYFPFDIAPNDIEGNKILYANMKLVSQKLCLTSLETAIIGNQSEYPYTKVSDSEFTLMNETYLRDSTKDVEVWNAPPEVETTKQATIDVSTYDPNNKPVITPTAGKQSMAEVEVTLNNIPSPSGGGTAYEWYIEGTSIPNFFSFGVAPSTLQELQQEYMLWITYQVINGEKFVEKIEVIDFSNVTSYEKISDTKVEIGMFGEVHTIEKGVRSFTLW